MSQRNSEVDGIVVVCAFVGMAMLAIGLFIAAVLGFLALIMTFLALLAWNSPLKLGEISIEPVEARAFVYRGLLGGAMLPLFLLFCAVLFQVPITQKHLDWFYHIVFAGYVIGSLGVEIYMANDEQNIASPPPAKPLPTRPAIALPEPEKKPFRYASWDDEEAAR